LTELRFYVPLNTK